MISVIVPAYNVEKTLDACLRSLENQSVARDGYEIIVVDDGSTDSTALVAGSHDVRVVRQARQGPGSARNHGARLAHGDTLLFTDADCVPAPDWIERMLQGFLGQDVVGVKGAYRTRQNSLTARFIQQEFEEKYDRIRGKHSIDFVDAYSAAYRLEVFRRVGGFDERFLLAEDIELSYRLASLGYRMIFQPEAVVYHQHVETLAEYTRKKFLSAYWRSLAYHRFPAKALRDSTTPKILYAQMPLAALLLASLVGAPIRAEAAVGIAVAALGFFASAIPFASKAWRRDRGAALATPTLLLARALALGAGLSLGTLTLARNRLSGKPMAALEG